MIICLEGIDACGKGTQAALLAERLKARVFKFPDRTTPMGRLIYGHLARKWTTVAVNEPSADRTEEQRDALVFQALHVANRMELAREVFEAASRGNVVLDRYWPSGYAYGRADGLDGEHVINMHAWLPQPDLFILLEATEAESTVRRPERRDRYENNPGFLSQVAANYSSLWVSMAEESPRRWARVAASGTPEQVLARIESAIAAWRLEPARAF